MHNSTPSLCLLAVMLSSLYLMCVADQPPYQVSIYIHLHPKGRPIHMCNGDIIQSRLVITSASCVHYQFIPESPMLAIYPSMLSVVAGTGSALSEAGVFLVSTINVLQGFNSTTGENDLAILRLSESLPLGLRDDMKWIILDDNEFRDNACLANFYVRNSMDTIPDYTQTLEMEILNSTQCTQLTNYPNARHADICSHYVLPLGFSCHALDAFIPFNGDRGTGLVCNDRLVAVLSTILPLQNENTTNCSEALVKAFYTNLGPHLDWIYSVIAYEEYIDITQENYKASPPYQKEMSAIMMADNAAALEPASFSNSDDPTTVIVRSTPRPEYFHAFSAGQQTTQLTRFFIFGVVFANLLAHAY